MQFYRHLPTSPPQWNFPESPWLFSTPPHWGPWAVPSRKRLPIPVEVWPTPEWVVSGRTLFPLSLPPAAIPSPLGTCWSGAQASGQAGQADKCLPGTEPALCLVKNIQTSGQFLHWLQLVCARQTPGQHQRQRNCPREAPQWARGKKTYLRTGRVRAHVGLVLSAKPRPSQSTELLPWTWTIFSAVC